MKKQKLLICVITALCLSICGCGSNKGDTGADTELPVEETQDYVMPEAYTSVLDKAFWLLVDYDSEYACDDGEVGIVEAKIGKEPAEALSKIGYACIDFDQNGTKELVIAEEGSDSGDRILAVYTIKNDRAILLFEGYVRSRYYYMGDNTFYYEGSGGAAYTVFGTYTIEDDGITVSATDYYFSDFKEIDDLDSYGWFHNTSGEYSIEASEEVTFSNDDEPFEMMEEYLKKTKSLDLTMFSDYESEYAINLLKEKALGGNSSDNQIGGNNNQGTVDETEKEDVVENGIFYKSSFDRYGEKVEGIVVNTEDNQLIISKPENAVETTFDKKTYAYTISNDWVTINYKYEIKDDIHSAVECENYIDSITAGLPMTLTADYAHDEESGVYIIQELKEFFSSDESYNFHLCNTSLDVHNVWYTSVGSEGVAYFYESCTYPTRQALTYSNMISQACNYHGGVALLETVEVTYFNYQEVYDSKGTTIEKNQLASELSSVLSALSYSYVSTPNGGTSFATCIYGFNNCLWNKVRLIK